MEKEKIKVLIILNNLEGGGAERVFVNIANEFADAGIDTNLLLGRKKGVYFDMLNPGIPVHELKAGNLFQYIKKLPGFLKNRHYTHIFTASDYISVATVLIKKILARSVKVIATLHYNLPYQLSILPRQHQLWIKYLNRNFISQADTIVAVSKGVAGGFKKIVGDNHCRHLTVIYNPAFDDSIYEKAGEKVAEALFDNNIITLINVGRLEPQKNQELLITAFHKLTQERGNIRLLIIGTGSLVQALRNQIDSLGLQEKIYLLGFKQNPFSYLAKSDLFVLSSTYEGLPTVLIEALALGINVVSTNCPSGPDEILDNGKYGWLAVNNNADSLAASMEQALLNKHRPDFLKQRALQFHKRNIISEYLKLVY